MKSLQVLFILLFSLNAFLFAEDNHDHTNVKAKHGGNILEIGEHVAHLEVVHDEKIGSIKVYVLDKEGNPKKITDAPKLNLTIKVDGKSSKKQIFMKPTEADQKVSDTFSAEDAIFKTEDFEGKIALKIDEKPYQVALKHDNHDHEHDDHHKD